MKQVNKMLFVVTRPQVYIIQLQTHTVTDGQSSAFALSLVHL